MPTSFPKASSPFFGREDYISRYRSRLSHYRFSIYVGLQGIGKTSLLFRLLEESESIGMETALYLPVNPGETVVSLLARVEIRLTGRASQALENKADCFRRLVDILSDHKALAVLDDLHNLRTEDLAPLVRTCKACEGHYRLLGAMQYEPDIAAMDKAGLHIELLKPLSAETVGAVVASYGLGPAARAQLVEDASRGGSSGHPLTLSILASLFGNDLPDDEFLKRLTARSIKSFQTIWESASARVPAEALEALAQISSVGLPLDLAIVQQAFGPITDDLVKRRLVDVTDGAVRIHGIIGRMVRDDSTPPLSPKVCKLLAKELRQRATKLSEPMGIIRAGELLAHAGEIDLAVETLSSGWESVRDLGFLQAYLKSLACIPGDATLSARLRVLSARARMRQGSPASMRAEMEQLAEQGDQWAASRALASLTYIYSEELNHEKVVSSFLRLEGCTDEADILLDAGTLAAVSMVKLERVEEAEALANRLLGHLQGRKQYDREGDMHRLIARVCAQAGHLADAISQAGQAAACFEKAGDLYHAAAAYGYIGDLHREAGEFEEAKKAFERFRALAAKWGDRNLIQIAELADAWVSLDIGDLTHASRLITEVEKELTGAPSRRLRRYLAAARVMLEAGRGKHAEVIEPLGRVIEMWVGAGQHGIADMMRAQQVRSLVAMGQVTEARDIVDLALKRLDPKIAGPRVAMFLRESALIRLRQKDTKTAMNELSKARKLFAKGGNRREEVLTLHRLAHAALDEGDVVQATKRAKEVLTLAKEIGHDRAIALARELESRVALVHGEVEEAVEAGKDSMVSLRKLGDDLGTLHVSELLLRAYIAAGDLSNAIRLGPRVGAHAERVGIREVRIRAIVLTGIALLRKGNVDAAQRCFREIPTGVLNPVTGALMWRLGEALAVVGQNDELRGRCRSNWVIEVKRMPDGQHPLALNALGQLAMAPRIRCNLMTREGEEMVGSEELAWFEPDQYQLCVDFQQSKVLEGEISVVLDSDDAVRLLNLLIVNEGHVVSYDDISELLALQAEKSLTPKQLEKKVRSQVKQVEKHLKGVTGIKITPTATGLKVKLPKNSAVVTPITLWDENLSPAHLNILNHLGGVSSASLQDLQDATALNRAAARREVDELIEAGHVEMFREGRGQSFRIA